MRLNELISRLSDLLQQHGDLPVCYPGISDDMEEIDSIDVGRDQNNQPFEVQVWNEFDNQERDGL